ncbi:MAG: copper chaperone PCu(A)C [Proteobacteria bacterium]|jgi:periplasmic copper chaperone A|nr:copper chaperone PCu(A)C [Pseudomonadota bacterium]MDA0941615.1 copper chaperone PCu(A)C [Pseudomonadota bacterium]MDA1035064.1 copper chaperone PCu(A)C [Pseudomonadota bacterium]
MNKFLLILILIITSNVYSEVKFNNAVIKNNFGKKVTAGFIEILADEDLAIKKIQSAFSPKIEIHSMEMENDVMKMRKIDSPKISKNKPFILKKGGNHLMIYDITQNLDEQKKVMLNFVFIKNDGTEISSDVEFLVQ